MYMLNFDFNVSILGPSRRSWMEFLAKLVNRFKPLNNFCKGRCLGVWRVSEYTSVLTNNFSFIP